MRGEAEPGPDPYDLSRSVLAQADDHEQAPAEVESGRERPHGMWSIFPQIGGLGRGSMSRR